jgi:hypothetical protein
MAANPRLPRAQRAAWTALMLLPTFLSGASVALAAAPESAAAISGGPSKPDDGPVAATFYESWRTKSCPNQPTCLINFRKVPADRILRVTNINCWINIQMEADWTIVQLVQGPKAEAVAKAAFPAAALNPESSIPAYMLNATTSSFIEPGKTPIIALNAGTEVPLFAAQCAISGDLLTP